MNTHTNSMDQTPNPRPTRAARPAARIHTIPALAVAAACALLGTAGCTEHADVPGADGQQQNASTPSSTGEYSGPATGALPPAIDRGADVNVPAGRLVVDGVVFDVPDSWRAEVPSSTMRAAQFAIDPPAGVDAPPAQVVVFRNIRGGIDANLERWRSQLSGDVQSSTEILEINGLTVHQFIGRGAFDAGMAGGPGTVQSLDGATVWGLAMEPQPGVFIYIKATAPTAVLAPARGTWDAFVASVRRDG